MKCLNNYTYTLTQGYRGFKWFKWASLFIYTYFENSHTLPWNSGKQLMHESSNFLSRCKFFYSGIRLQHMIADTHRVVGTIMGTVQGKLTKNQFKSWLHVKDICYQCERLAWAVVDPFHSKDAASTYIKIGMWSLLDMSQRCMESWKITSNKETRTHLARLLAKEVTKRMEMCWYVRRSRQLFQLH